MAKQIVDKSAIAIPQGTMEDFKRPDHPDFMDSAELRKAKWSGLRHNSLTDEAEIWMLGEVAERVSKQQTLLNPLAINEAYEKVFCLKEVMPDTLDARLYVADRNRRKGD